MLSALFGRAEGDVVLLKNFMDLWVGRESGNIQPHSSEHNFQEPIGPLTLPVDYSGSGESQGPRLS